MTIPAGTNTGCLDVTILDDLIVEDDENIILIGNLVNPPPMVTVDNTGTILIVDNDREYYH